MAGERLFRKGVAPKRSLALILGIVSGLCLFAWASPPSGQRRLTDLLVSLALGLAAFLVLRLGGRHPIVLQLMLVLVYGAGTLIAATRLLGASQVLAVVTFILAAAFAGYYMSLMVAMMNVTAMTVLYELAVRADRLIEWQHLLVASLLVIGAAAAAIGIRRSRESAVSAMSDIATIDPLTRALNRRGLEILAPALRATAARAGHQTMIVMIDLDDFKKFNDEAGHAAGDELLRSLVQRWRACLGEEDLLARVGGDEFAIVLPNADDREVDRLLAAMRVSGGCSWTMGCSRWLEGQDLWSAVAHADDALYRAKRRR